MLHRSERRRAGKKSLSKCSGAENQKEDAKRSVLSFDGEGGGEKADARRRVHTAVRKARNRAKGGGRSASTYTRPCASLPVSAQKAEAAKARVASACFFRDTSIGRWQPAALAAARPGYKPALVQNCCRQPCDAFYPVSFLRRLCRNAWGLRMEVCVAAERWNHGPRHSMQARSHPFR